MLKKFLNNDTLKGAAIGALGSLAAQHIGDLFHHDVADAASAANDHQDQAKEIKQNASETAKNIGKTINNQSEVSGNSENHPKQSTELLKKLSNTNDQNLTKNNDQNTTQATNNDQNTTSATNNDQNDQNIQNSQYDPLKELVKLNNEYQHLSQQEALLKTKIDQLQSYVDSILDGKIPAGQNYQNALQQLEQLKNQYQQIQQQKDALEDQIDTIKDNIEDKVHPDRSMAWNALKLTGGALAATGLAAGIAAYNKNNTPRKKLVKNLGTRNFNSSIKFPQPKGYYGLSAAIKNKNINRYSF